MFSLGSLLSRSKVDILTCLILFEYYLYGQKHQETDFSVATSQPHAKNKPCLATCFVNFDLYGPAPSDESHPRWSRPWLAPQTSPGWSRPSLRVHGPDRPTAVQPLKTTFRFECISWKIAHPGLWLNPWRKGPKSSCEGWPARANFQILVERIITSQAQLWMPFGWCGGRAGWLDKTW